MGKLNIAHHKSYHPYRRDNIEKVRKDEEEAKQKEEREEGRMMLADSEARIDRLRERAGVAEKSSSKKKRKDTDDLANLEAAEGSFAKSAVLPTVGGHINFFEDLEHNAIAAAIRASKKTDPAEAEKGVPLAPSAKDLKPWYSERKVDTTDEEKLDDRRKRDAARKSVHDPLTSITHQLASKFTPSTSSSYRSRPPPPRPLPSDSSSMPPPEVQARLSRESSERERALELIRRKKREMRGSETPSTVHGELDNRYEDVFNRREVEEAHRTRDRRWDGRERGHDRGWANDDRSRTRGRGRPW